MTTSLPATKRATLTISQLNRQAKRLLEGNFASVWVEGEISNFSRPSSGHWYFSLKDSGAQVRCAMFKGANSRLRFQVEAGQQLIARAKLSLYEARGDYQLIVEHLEPVGDGALAKAFEQLKNTLAQQGLFSPDHKQPLPSLPRHIAIITSPTGAAIHDMLTVLARRFPSTKVTLLPVAVQGQGAAAQIASAIEQANWLAVQENAAQQRHDFDVILTGRGGGSMEDLWAFNEQVVAMAIFNSQLPVVSAVGHEVDFTIADFVADVRAPTPSAAAELLSPNQQDMLDTLQAYERQFQQQMRRQLERTGQQLNALQARLRHPGSRLQEHAQRLDELELRLTNSWRNQHRQLQLRIDLLQARLQQQTPHHLIVQLSQSAGNLYQRLELQLLRQLERAQQRFNAAVHLLDTVSPLATLDRGYGITSTLSPDQPGQIINDASELKPGQKLLTRLAKGRFYSTVDSIDEGDLDRGSKELGAN